MDWIFDNLQYIGLIVFAFIAWLNKRSESKSEAEDAERARQEMIDGMEEMARTKPQRQQPQATPPPVKQATPPPLHAQPKAPAAKAKAPDPYSLDQSPLNRNDKLQKQLAEARQKQEESREMAQKARDKRLRAEPHAPRVSSAAAGAPTSLKAILRDPRQSRRAIVLREILGPPVALKR